MRARSLRVVLAAIAACSASMAALAACASDETMPFTEPDAAASVVPAPDAGLDVSLDDADTDPCTPDALCPNGPFDPNTPGGGLDLGTRITVIRGRSASDVWAAGARGAVVHFDGTSWTGSDTGTQETMNGLWLRESEEVALSSLASVYSRGLEAQDAAPSAGGWAHEHPPGPSQLSRPRQLGSCWTATSAEWLWCASVETEPYNAADHVNGLWRIHVAPSTRTLAIENAVPLGTCDVLPCRYMTSVHGASADDLWAVGFTGAAVHVSGAQSATPSITAFDSHTLAGLNGVWAASGTEAWAVGGAGTVCHYEDKPPSWSVVSGVPATETLRAVWGTSSADVWAVGDGAVVLHFDGKSWSRVKVAGLGARRPNLFAVWTPAPGHVWVGGEGVLLSLGGKP